MTPAEKFLIPNIWGGGDFLEKISAANKIDFNKNFNALLQNLIPTFSAYVPPQIFNGKMETFLACRKLCEFMRENGILNERTAKFFEETSLACICSVYVMNITEINLLIAELPKILKLNYPAVSQLRSICLEFIPQILDSYRIYNPAAWRKFVNLKYLVEMLKSFDDVKK